LENTNAPGDGM